MSSGLAMSATLIRGVPTEFGEQSLRVIKGISGSWERVKGKDMRLLPTAHRDKQVLHRSRTLWEMTSQLKELAEGMRADGLREEADSLETTIRDLGWQYEALINKELLAEWPNGPRRPLRSQLRAVR